MIVYLDGQEVEIQVDGKITIMHCGEIHVADACLKKCLKKLEKAIAIKG